MFIIDRAFSSKRLEDFGRENYENSIDADILFDDENLIKNRLVCEISNAYNPKLYTNSERAVNWIRKNMGESIIGKKLEFFKDKYVFRNLIADSFPNFNYRKINISETDIPLSFPFIVKPVEGFLSEGIFLISNNNDWVKFLEQMQNSETSYIAEEVINGDEFAVDAYFNSQGNPVILNIFKHPFLNDENMADRLYYTSKKIIEAQLPTALGILSDISKYIELKNFPLHLEYRNGLRGAIPIELNPMRFAGWCTTELTYYAYQINPYQYFQKDKSPDWEMILKEKSPDDMYYFAIAENSMKLATKSLNKTAFINDFENPLEMNFAKDENIMPIFGVIFGETHKKEEIYKILKMDICKYIN